MTTCTRYARTRGARGLLYAAAQHGVYVSYDDGARWESLSLNLPDVPVSDLLVKDNELVISTHGRGFWVLDNVAPLRQVTPAISASADPWLFAPPPAYRSGMGATINYWLKAPAKRVSIDILDANGKSFARSPPTRAPRAPLEEVVGAFGGFQAPPPSAVGMNRFTWDLNYAPATTFQG